MMSQNKNDGYSWVTLYLEGDREPMERLRFAILNKSIYLVQINVFCLLFKIFWPVLLITLSVRIQMILLIFVHSE